jgi:hypothetical protein
MMVSAVLITALLGSVAPAFGQNERAVDVDLQVPRRPEVTILFYTGEAYGQGAPLGAYPIGILAPEQLAGARFIDVRVCNMPHVFAVEQIASVGRTVGTTTVRVRTGTMALSEVVRALEDACHEAHISVTAHMLGANMVPVASVTPEPPDTED